MDNIYTVGDYLLDRLSFSGISELFGVPGDYNLKFLDSVINHQQITWVGCTNELNAAYGADGYARTKGIGALLTTFGVGELSALNGVAGSFAEYVPVIHIVGSPALTSQRKGELMHHTLGDGNFGHFMRMSQPVSVAQAALTPENALSEIDRVIEEVIYHSRPGYILLPSDVAALPVTTRAHALPARQPPFSPSSLEAFVAAAETQLRDARRVSLLADFLADRFDVKAALEEWMEEVPLPHATLLMGKGLFNEQQTNFAGTYSGAGSAASTREAIEGADVVINVGVKFTDTITAGFTQQLPDGKCIDLQPFSARVGDQIFHQLPMAKTVSVLHRLTAELASGWQPYPVKRTALPASHEGHFGQYEFWQQIQDFLQPGDILVAEQGTACFGAAALNLPEDCQFVVQPLWGSIGFTLPAAFGVQIAAPARRVVLLIGDGSAQLTLQGLGAAIRYGLPPVIFVINNDGYTVERAIHGETQRYNDIAQWNWTQFPSAFGGNDVFTARADSPQALKEAIEKAGAHRQMAWIEVVLPKMDIPELLSSVTKSLAKRNSGQ
ncbi:indolepyruvate decarboxylase [Rahnella sp. BCC 1045]|jgi:indolepyruvate decarboxylase|uniref:alpha-keto acid decarboxylase family protein n=1 Tax=unclassified Rahnella TaxID=2635087 RepID=UPI0012660307|nr:MULTISPECIES: alpha-keto acid decarboxylase family protein [unclassified Rahnella]KAB8311236.1 indolepyruvate decarboxylase [Rouxiella chamberiensis]MBU9822609.1 indolepyruvate decarboxylase [Rahnella sp. BCC 1045]MCS3423320.1 indolepyruvate decarboxylase [Rahnella sp. BIGb0603]